jgi:AAA15 family ATPase/GTPase
MKLESIVIKNIRCIEDTTIDIRDYTSLIGPNNCGKSSVLRAIEILLGQQTPDIEEWRKGHRDMDLVIEGEFGDLQEWEKSTPGVAGTVHADKIRLRVRFSIEPDTEKIKKSTKHSSPRNPSPAGPTGGPALQRKSERLQGKWG